MAAILDFHYNILHINYFRRHSVGGATLLQMVHMGLTEVCAVLSAF